MIVEKKNVPENSDWIKINCARAFLLFANLVGLIEILLCAVSACACGKDPPNMLCVPHVIILVVEGEQI